MVKAEASRDDVCPGLPSGTEVSTLRGLIAIEDIKVGERIVTRDHGAQKVLQIVSQLQEAETFAIAPHQLGEKRPERLTFLAGATRILARGTRVLALFGNREVMTKARFVGKAAPEVRRMYHTLIFATAQIIYANGLEVETSCEHPDTRFRKTVDSAESTLLS